MSMQSPIEQFEVHGSATPLFDIGGHAIHYSNFAMAALTVFVLALLFILLPMRRRSVIPGRWQVFVEVIYKALDDLLSQAAGPKAKPFFPFIFSIFLFIVLSNILGLVPGFYTVTAQFITNFALAMSVILVVLGAGFYYHGAHFLKIFVPSGVPAILLPIITAIEVVSFFVRPFSLSLRLFANMLAGHILLKVFAGMTAAIATSGWVASVGVLPLIMNVCIVCFEVFVALLQAYIFTILSSVYLRDALEMH